MRNRFVKRWREGWREGGKKEEDIWGKNICKKNSLYNYFNCFFSSFSFFSIILLFLPSLSPSLPPSLNKSISHFFYNLIIPLRDLPLKINQWANVVRWEMRTRPFLRRSVSSKSVKLSKIMSKIFCIPKKISSLDRLSDHI